MVSIRGAHTVKENTREAILASTKEMLEKIIQENKLEISQIISIVFTATKDLTKVYPAVAARELGLKNCSLICCQEMDVEKSLKQCIRVLIHAELPVGQNNVQHIYLGEAKKLRVDITQPLNIAIDGPAGAGKSTIAKKLAQTLSCIYVDTGAMYRAIGYAMYQEINDGIYDEDKRHQWIEKNLSKVAMRIDYKQGEQQIYVLDENVTLKIRTQKMGHIASLVSAHPKVRQFLLQEQQKLAKAKAVVMDGRDIGTHVLPDAGLKIFLTASVEVRAMRRFKDLKEKGEEPNLQQIQNEIEERDQRDMEREHAPLVQAEDAICLDTSNMGINDVVQAIYLKAQELME